MLRRTFFRQWKARAPTTVDPLQLFEQVEIGAAINQSQAKGFIMNYFANQLHDRGINEGRVHTMDGKALHDLLRSLLFERYVSVPFSLFSFDLEFTGLPGQAARPASIIEIGLFCPDTGNSYSSLVKPLTGTTLTEEAAKLTKITEQDLEAAPSFDVVWKEAQDFMSKNAQNEESKERVLLLSHGAKLADIKMLQDECRVFDLELPSRIKFGDTYNTIRDLHRKRPVTKDRHPPSWSLVDLGYWLNIDVPAKAHRALPDAVLTWDVLYHTLDRYGDASLPPRQQLVGRYFADSGDDSLRSLIPENPGKTGKSGKPSKAAMTVPTESWPAVESNAAFDVHDLADDD